MRGLVASEGVALVEWPLRKCTVLRHQVRVAEGPVIDLALGPAGHARVYCCFDVLYRFLRQIGYDVFYVR